HHKESYSRSSIQGAWLPGRIRLPARPEHTPLPRTGRVRRTLNGVIGSVRLWRSRAARFSRPRALAVIFLQQEWNTRISCPKGERTGMSLSIAEVAKVALLARLRVSPADLETFTSQLNSIVDYVAQLQELDTTGVEPLAHGIELRNVFRNDVRGPAVEREQALSNAPKRNAVRFLVPAVLE